MENASNSIFGDTFWSIFITIIIPILTTWFYIRRANGQFDGGDFNKNDREYAEDCEKYGYDIAIFKENFRNTKKFFKK